jgi:uncharacterized protein YkwD
MKGAMAPMSAARQITSAAALKRRSSRLIALVLAITVGFTLGAPPASAELSDSEKKLVGLINKARANRDVGKLKTSAMLSKLARKHSTAMMNQGNPVMHSSTSQLYHYMDEANCAARIGENVGRASDVNEMHQAFMGSAGHRENVLASYWKKVGVGIRKSGGNVWTTELFCV